MSQILPKKIKKIKIILKYVDKNLLKLANKHSEDEDSILDIHSALTQVLEILEDEV